MTEIQRRMRLIGAVNVQLNTKLEELVVAENNGDLLIALAIKSEMDSLYAFKDVIRTFFHNNTEVTSCT